MFCSNRDSLAKGILRLWCCHMQSSPLILQACKVLNWVLLLLLQYAEQLFQGITEQMSFDVGIQSAWYNVIAWWYFFYSWIRQHLFLYDIGCCLHFYHRNHYYTCLHNSIQAQHIILCRSTITSLQCIGLKVNNPKSLYATQIKHLLNVHKINSKISMKLLTS